MPWIPIRWSGGTAERSGAIRPSVLLLERGQVFELGGKRVFAMGGARSHDIQDSVLKPDDPLFDEKFRRLQARDAAFRVNRRSWWKKELPAPEEYRQARVNLERAGWRVDYIVTHCAPTSIQNELLRAGPPRMPSQSFWRRSGNGAGSDTGSSGITMTTGSSGSGLSCCISR